MSIINNMPLKGGIELQGIEETYPIASGQTIKAGDFVRVANLPKTNTSLGTGTSTSLGLGGNTLPFSIGKHIFSYYSTQGYTTKAYLSSNSSYTVSISSVTQALKFMLVLEIDDNNGIGLAADGWYKISISGNSWSTSLLSSSYILSTIEAGYSSVKLEDNKWCVGYTLLTSGKYQKYLRIIDYNATSNTLSFGNQYGYDTSSSTQSYSYSALGKLSSNYFVSAAGISLYLFSYSGTTITKHNEQGITDLFNTISANDFYLNSVESNNLEDGRVLVVWSIWHFNDDNYTKFCSILYNNGTTLKATQAFNLASNAYIKIIKYYDSFEKEAYLSIYCYYTYGCILKIKDRGTYLTGSEMRINFTSPQITNPVLVNYMGDNRYAYLFTQSSAAKIAVASNAPSTSEIANAVYYSTYAPQVTNDGEHNAIALEGGSSGANIKVIKFS